MPNAALRSVPSGPDSGAGHDPARCWAVEVVVGMYLGQHDISLPEFRDVLYEASQLYRFVTDGTVPLREIP